MGGQRNSKMLKLLGGAAVLLISTYVLYSYRQTSNDLQLKLHHLKEAKDEYSALSRRFDMLSNELKGTVQTSADLDRKLRVEKKSHHQTQNEKLELERQCHTESLRLENDRVLVVKEKQQLIEDKDQVKRERDRISSRLETLTQECGEARESAQSHERQLQVDCDGRVEQCQARARGLEGDLNICRGSLEVANSGATQCSNELQAQRNNNLEYQSRIVSLEEQLRRLQIQSPQQGGVNNPQQRGGFNNPQLNVPQQGGRNIPQQGGHNNPQQGGRNIPQQGGRNIPQQGGRNNPQQGLPGGQANPNPAWQSNRDRVNPQPAYRDKDPNLQAPPSQQHDTLLRRDTGGLQALGQKPRDTGGLQAGREPRDTGGLQALGHEPRDTGGLQALGQEPGELAAHELGQAAGESHHKTTEEKKAIYRALRDKVQRGVSLNEKQQQVYQLLSRQYGEEVEHLEEERREEGRPASQLGVQEPAPRLLEEGGQEVEHPAPQLLEEAGREVDENRVRAALPDSIQRPPVPGGQNSNNEQEEVKDLVDGGQQKPGVFENVKEQQPEAAEEGGAGGPNNEDSDEGVELHNFERDDRPLDNVDNVEVEGHPLPKPIANPLDHADQEVRGKGGVVNEEGVDDDDDVGDYGAVELEEKRNQAAGNQYQDEGHDQKMMYNQEKRRLIQREAQEKVPDEDVAGERDGHWREQQFQGGAAARREMR